MIPIEHSQTYGYRAAKIDYDGPNCDASKIVQNTTLETGCVDFCRLGVCPPTSWYITFPGYS